MGSIDRKLIKQWLQREQDTSDSAALRMENICYCEESDARNKNLNSFKAVASAQILSCPQERTELVFPYSFIGAFEKTLDCPVSQQSTLNSSAVRDGDSRDLPNTVQTDLVSRKLWQVHQYGSHVCDSSSP